MKNASTRDTRGFIALALLVVLLLGAALSGVFAYRQNNLTDKPFSLLNSGRSLDTSGDVSQVKAVASRFALRMDSLGSADVPGYIENVSELLTTRCRADFAKSEPALTGSIGTVSFTTKGFVRAVGIATLDKDSATVLVVHDAQKTAESGQSLLSAYRWTVTLRKVDGTWLVDKFADPDRGGEAC